MKLYPPFTLLRHAPHVHWEEAAILLQGCLLLIHLRRLTCSALALWGALSVSACVSPTPLPLAYEPTSSAPRARAYNRPYQVRGHWYTPAAQPDYDVVGVASWYSYEAHNRTTADGEPFEAARITAAHTTLPIPSYLEVTNLENGRRTRVRLNDRGPFVAGRIIDLSRGAAEQLGFLVKGTARVRVRYLGPAPAVAPRLEIATARVGSQPPTRPADP